MKIKLLIKTIICCCILFLSGCNSSQKVYSCRCRVNNTDKIVLRTTGYGNTERNAELDACRYAIEQILFRGIPDSDLHTPLISTNEQEVRTSNSNYFKELFDKGRYASFISFAPIVESGVKRGTHWVVCDVTVNLRALRSDLENNKIIRKFGY